MFGRNVFVVESSDQSSRKNPFTPPLTKNTLRDGPSDSERIILQPRNKEKATEAPSNKNRHAIFHFVLFVGDYSHTFLITFS